MAMKGIGNGLDSLIPDYYDEDFDSNSTQSLEDMLNDGEEEKSVEDVIEEVEEEIQSGEEEDIQSADEEEIPEEETDEPSQDEESEEEEDEEDIDPVVLENVKEVKEIVDKNPRITLWSSRSSAVFRYLRKTEPEFSISKEASTLIEEAVSKKYPEIWKLFED